MRTEEVDRRQRGMRWLVLALLLATCTGCPFGPLPPDGTDTARPNLDTPGNASIRDASALPLADADEITFTGSVDQRSDIDVYDLGLLTPGDRIYVDVRTISGDLDPVAAIFDSREYLVAYNDDREPDGTVLDPLIDIVIRGPEDRYYVGIIAYPGYASTGEYEAVVRIERGVGVPSPVLQVVYLNWAGGRNIQVPNVGRFDLAAFSATDVGLPSSQTEDLKNRVQQIIEDRYAGYNLIVLNSDDDVRPGIEHTTVHFGGSNRRAFAISEKIDTFNTDHADDAIVFTESYLGAFGSAPTFEQIAQALGNTVAHEVGHLLGLVHTRDCDSLMDASCSNVRILSPQSFQTARLDVSVFPFGFQPAEDILTWLLGLVGL